ncbi:TraR/DksA C4-type zinc finger protein [Chitinolyticbacter albus]|uniref:TraR/DksA C4-type zinc finger protein n=1 Tax=Chitinolyticbacter albus TaxID=2961951 RepID=UPI00210EC5FD|nr:TraR/DksA C4-type zinc finger protein [Chitinolyticbacter albus]
MLRTFITPASTKREPILPLETADDYLSPTKLTFFRNLLLAQRDALLDVAQETANHPPTSEATSDPSDRASLEEEHALELTVREREHQFLQTIELALSRLSDGSYGWCQETGEPIGIPRLTARPTATLTLEAQERLELRHKLLRR